MIESADYRMELDPEAAWQMSKEEEMSQREANAHALTGFMDRLMTRDDRRTGAH